MKAEYNNYYQLSSDKYYFSVSLQRLVKFQGVLAVKCGSGFGDCGHFGYLIDTSFPGGTDYETKEEIEFSDEDVIEEYGLRNMTLNFLDASNKTV